MSGGVFHPPLRSLLALLRDKLRRRHDIAELANSHLERDGKLLIRIAAVDEDDDIGLLRGRLWKLHLLLNLLRDRLPRFLVVPRGTFLRLLRLTLGDALALGAAILLIDGLLHELLAADGANGLLDFLTHGFLLWGLWDKNQKGMSESSS